ncbi:1516_t:CDS:2, partial [Acaulospora colombiana]
PDGIELLRYTLKPGRLRPNNSTLLSISSNSSSRYQTITLEAVGSIGGKEFNATHTCRDLDSNPASGIYRTDVCEAYRQDQKVRQTITAFRLVCHLWASILSNHRICIFTDFHHCNSPGKTIEALKGAERLRAGWWENLENEGLKEALRGVRILSLELDERTIDREKFISMMPNLRLLQIKFYHVKDLQSLQYLGLLFHWHTEPTTPWVSINWNLPGLKALCIAGELDDVARDGLSLFLRQCGQNLVEFTDLF